MRVSGKLALVKRWIGIILGKNRVAVEQGQGKLYKKESIAGYYNDLTGKVNEKTLLDKNGITINLIEGNQLVYFPISIFQYALGLYDLYLEHDDADIKAAFLKQSEWIVDNQRPDGSWDCFGPIGYHQYSVSSMGQGEAISALARAYILTHDDRWSISIQNAMHFMMKSVKDGGTVLEIGADAYFEEYPDIQGEKRSVLNGWIFSLFGLYDYLILYPNAEEVGKLYWKSVETLKRHLNDYDMGYWSFYDKSGRVASPAYHDLHIALLKVLADLTEEQYFETVADKWERYANKPINRIRAITRKTIQKLKEKPEGIIIQ